MHKKSVKDVCLGQDKTLCIITFSNGPISEEVENILKDAKRDIESNRSNFHYKFSWIDSSKHKDWVEKLDIEDNGQLQVRVLRTGRRNKYIPMTGEFTRNNISKLVEKIIGGDARSYALRSGIPEFAKDL